MPVIIGILILPIIVVAIPVVIIVEIIKRTKEKQYRQLEEQVLTELGIFSWEAVSGVDEDVIVKSRQALENYDEIKFFKENRDKVVVAENVIRRKLGLSRKLKMFIDDNYYKSRPQYRRLESKINDVLYDAGTYRIRVTYISSAGNNLGNVEIPVDAYCINRLKSDPSLLMGKGEYNKYLKELQKETLEKKHHEYYERVNVIIEFANENRDALIIKGGQDRLEVLTGQLFDKTVNSIKKIKAVDSEEWDIIGGFIDRIESEIRQIVYKNNRILAYYESSDFLKIKETCEVLMCTQREFNEYISEKVQSISQLFGTKVIRNETINEDEYNYIRAYKKIITPFTAEVSAAVFASAENSPLEYVVKHFYPNKKQYPEQINKLYLLIEELETLREAKQIIENYKVEYRRYLGDVPDFIMEEDEAGFYARLGFANIDESVLTVEYKFVYTSGGGMARRYFTVPMKEETIIELIRMLESKLTASAFAKAQRALMTKKLREFIKSRDNFTCCSCGNSTYIEPNLLLEIDHIIPVAKGGRTEEENLQTLCWKCNREKSDKIIT